MKVHAIVWNTCGYVFVKLYSELETLTQTPCLPLS